MSLDFFYLVSELKKVPRRGWINKLGIEHPESVADHSYVMSVMAMILSDIQNLDTKKILKMALIHDLAETITGDFMPDEISKNNKKSIELESIKEILSKLPSKISEEYLQVWQEYEDCSTKESLLVHDVDKLEMAIQAMKYSAEGYPNEKLITFIDAAKKEIKSKELLNMIDSISYK